LHGTKLQTKGYPFLICCPGENIDGIYYSWQVPQYSQQQTYPEFSSALVSEKDSQRRQKYGQQDVYEGCSTVPHDDDDINLIL
jgi:hypothetical protein